MKRILKHMVANLAVYAFIAIIIILSVGTLYKLRGNIRSWCSGIVNNQVGVVIEDVNNKVKENVIGEKIFINIYGAVCRVLDRNVMEDAEKTVVKDKKGNLHFLTEAISENEASIISTNIINLQEHCENQQIPFTYVSIPSKEEKYEGELPVGIEDYSGSNKNLVLGKLKENGIDILDLMQEELTYYKTDHHWTIRSAFHSAQIIGKHLTENQIELGYNLKELFSENNYQFEVEDEEYIGSQGRRTGKLYAGADEFVSIIPQFETEYTYVHYKNDDITLEKKGNFEEALIAEPVKSVFSPEYYLTYSNNTAQCEIHIENKRAENDVKIILIGDSYTRPLAAYMSLYVREVVNIDTQEGRFQKNIYEFINEMNPDYVIVAQNSGMYGTEGVFEYREKGDYIPENFAETDLKAVYDSLLDSVAVRTSEETIKKSMDELILSSEDGSYQEVSLLLQSESLRYRKSPDERGKLFINAVTDYLLEHSDDDGDGECGWGSVTAFDAYADGSVNPPNTEYAITNAGVLSALQDAVDSGALNDNIKKQVEDACVEITKIWNEKYVIKEKSKGVYGYWYSSRPEDAKDTVNTKVYLAGAFKRVLYQYRERFKEAEYRKISTHIENIMRQTDLDMEELGDNVVQWRYTSPGDYNDGVHFGFIVEGIYWYKKYAEENTDWLRVTGDNVYATLSTSIYNEKLMSYPKILNKNLPATFFSYGEVVGILAHLDKELAYQVLNMAQENYGFYPNYNHCLSDCEEKKFNYSLRELCFMIRAIEELAYDVN